MSSPAPNLRSYSGVDARRSSRIERAVPLLVIGTDKTGQSFLEETSAFSLNLHGCRYASRHEYPIESHVTLQVLGTEGRADARLLRARVRSIFPPQTRRELCQVGVEFEMPGNVGGISAPPDDWQLLLSGVPANAAAAATPPEPGEILPSAVQTHMVSEERRTEVARFPLPIPALVSSHLAREKATTRAERATATPDELIMAIQRKLQQAADKAVENAISTRLDEAVRKGLERINEASKSTTLQVSRVDGLQGQTEEQLITYSGRADEIAHRLELLNSDARSSFSEMKRFVEQAKPQLESQSQALLDRSFACASEELEKVAAQVSERQIAHFTQATESVLQKALAQLEERVVAARPLLDNHADAASPARVEASLRSTKQETLAQVAVLLQELRSQWDEQHALQRNRLEEIAQKLERPNANSLVDARELPKSVEQAMRGLESQIQSLLESSVKRATEEFEGAAARASDRQLIRLKDERQRFAGEAVLEIEAGTSEARALLLKTAHLTVEDFRRQLGTQIELAMSEAIERMNSSLGALEAESRTACDARRRSLESDVSRAAEQSTQEFRSGIKAFLYSCLVAAVSAVDEHAQTTRNGLSRDAVPMTKDLTPFSGIAASGKNGSGGGDNSQ